VEARAGEAGAEEEEAVVAERWKVDLERFHHDGITGARDERLAVGVGLMASEPEREWTETTTTTATATSGLAKEEKKSPFFVWILGWFFWVVCRCDSRRFREGKKWNARGIGEEESLTYVPVNSPRAMSSVDQILQSSATDERRTTYINIIFSDPAVVNQIRRSG
jgi:hypothetical protein